MKVNEKIMKKFEENFFSTGKVKKIASFEDCLKDYNLRKEKGEQFTEDYLDEMRKLFDSTLFLHKYDDQGNCTHEINATYHRNKGSWYCSVITCNESTSYEYYDIPDSFFRELLEKVNLQVG